MKTLGNRAIVAELAWLRERRILTADQALLIGERYPTGRWDIAVLIRWFTILGAVTAGVGVVLSASNLAMAIHLGEAALAGTVVGLIVLARWLIRAKGLVKTAAAVEMVSGFALQGLLFLVAYDVAPGGDNWPALVGIQAASLAVLAYVLRNRLVLIHACVCFFTFFGGETGYVSGYGAYWLKMTYPVRFLAAGAVFLAIAWAHAVRLTGAFQSFSRVYAHFGLLIIHLALWFLSLFGWFGARVRWNDTDGERLLFSALWAGVSVACLWLAGTIGKRMLRGYGLTFLIIDAYTFYFQFIVARSGEAWFVHLLLVGSSLVALGFWLERRLKHPDPQVGLNDASSADVD